MKKVILVEKKRVFDGIFKIDEARLYYEKFNGQMTPEVRRLNFERGDSVAALLFNLSTQKIILVNQFKYPTYEKGPGWITETVAGMIDANESPETAVRREILEETGFQVSNVEYISTFYVSPGGTSERISLYYTEVKNEHKIGEGGGAAKENEDISIIELSLEEAMKQVKEGMLVDAKTIIGIFWLQNRQQQLLPKQN
jgi:ADP-ribose pyrophosphatase